MRRVGILLLFVWGSLGVALAQSTKFDYIFQEAVRQKLANHLDAAIDLFDYCHRLEPESGVVLYELAQLYGYAKNDSLAIDALEKACRLYPDNYWYKNRLMSSYVMGNRKEDALRVVEDMAQQFPEKSEVLMMLLGLYGEGRDYANMVKVLDKIEVKEGKSEQLSMEKYRLFLLLGEEKKAFDEMTSLAEEYPNDLRYQVMIGDLYLDAGKKKEAMEQYRQVEQKDSNNVVLQISLSNYYQQEGADSLYRESIARLLLNPNLEDEHRLRLMGMVVKENLEKNADSTQVLNMFDTVLQMPQEQTDMLELKVRYMVTKRMPKEDVKPVLLQILEMDPECDMARQQLLSYAIEENDAKGIVEVCKPAVGYNAPDPVFYYYLGVGYYQLEQSQEAIDAFQAGLERVDNSDNGNKIQMRVNMYALMGDLYHRLGDDDKAFAAYDSCLVYKTNDAMVLNNYAYYLSLKKKDLKRAEEMSRQANELEPDNATYLDTYAWVLYQQKRYAEAKQYIDKVVELMKEDEEEMSDDVKEHIEKINKKVKR